MMELVQEPMSDLHPLWALPWPGPTDLSARSRVRPEKSKKLRYSPATSLQNSLLPGGHGHPLEAGHSKQRGYVGSGPWPPRSPNLQPASPQLPLPAGQSGSDSSTLGGGLRKAAQRRRSLSQHLPGSKSQPGERTMGREDALSPSEPTAGNRGHCHVSRIYRRGRVARAREQEWTQPQARQGTGPESQGKDQGLTGGRSKKARSASGTLFLLSGDALGGCWSIRERKGGNSGGRVPSTWRWNAYGA